MLIFKGRKEHFSNTRLIKDSKLLLSRVSDPVFEFGSRALYIHFGVRLSIDV